MLYLKKEIFAQRVKSLREKKDITQKELAGLLGVKRSTVGSWEAAHRWPELEKVKMIAEYFEVPVDYLLGGPLSTKRQELDRRNFRDYIFAATSLPEAIERIFEMDYLDSFTDDVFTGLVREAKQKYDMPSVNGPSTAAHGPKIPGSVVYNNSETKNNREKKDGKY